MKKLNIDKKIFVPAAAFMLLFILYGAIAPQSFAVVTTAVKTWFGTNFAWAALLMAMVCSFTLLCLVISKFGGTIIGGPDAKPEYKTHTWIFMIICGNIGIAMMFYAVIEPISFFTDPPAFWNVAAGTDLAAERAIAQSTFHWASVTWVIDMFAGFAGVLLCINYGLPFRPSSSLYPILKERTFGPIGTAYDVLCLVAILGGLMTGFGFGITQFCTGLSFTTGIGLSNGLYASIVVIACLILIFSSTRGFKKGLAVFSTVNSYMYIFFIVFLLAVGPTIKLLELIVGGAGALISEFIPMGFNGDFLGDDNGWNVDYTTFTWLWGFVYGPFTGMYLAKISKGRSLRAFIGVVVLVSTAFMLVWFAVWGGNAISLSVGGVDLMGTINEWGAAVANFATVQNLPFTGIITVILFACIAIGYITLVDALSNVIAGMCVTKVDSNLDTSPIVRTFWIIILGASTLVCLFALDEVGMSALQSLTVTLGVPLCFICVAITVGLFRMISGKTQEYITSPEGQEGLKKAQATVGSNE